MDWKLVLQVIGVALGLLYLYLEYKADIRLWIIGLLMPVVHGILYFRAGLYADFGMQMYYVAAGVYGFAVWMSKGRRQEKQGTQETQENGSGISYTPAKLYLPLVAVYALLHVLLYLFLSRCTDSTVPFWDAMTTALSVVAMWMLSRKYVEQWMVWCVVDAVTVALYFYKGIPLTGCLYVLYTVLAVLGWRRWKRMAGRAS